MSGVRKTNFPGALGDKIYEAGFTWRYINTRKGWRIGFPSISSRDIGKHLPRCDLSIAAKSARLVPDNCDSVTATQKRKREREREREREAVNVDPCITIYRVTLRASRNQLRFYLTCRGMYSASQNLRIRFRCGDRGAYIFYILCYVYLLSISARSLLSLSLSLSLSL